MKGQDNMMEKISELLIDKNRWDSCTSATVVSTTSNYIMYSDKHVTRTYRMFFKPREWGKFTWRFWHSNSVDSTWDDGSYSLANVSGGNWRIEKAYLADGGLEPSSNIVPLTKVQITFNGKDNKDVAPNEQFWSDEVEFTIPEDHYVAFTWTLSNKSLGKTIPFNTETPLVSTYAAEGDCAEEEEGTSFTASDNCLAAPSLIAYEKPVIKKIAFFGDSITQGVRTKMDGYEYWVAKIAEKLGPSYGVWNLGSGWARAYDAVTNGAWLHKAKMNDEVIICLGVNDIGTGKRSYEQLNNDIEVTVNKIKEHNPICKVILCTIPPFDFIGEEEAIWRKLNTDIQSNYFKGVDKVFDIASVLSEQKPRDNYVKEEYKSGKDDPHPNGIAGTDIAKAFMAFYERCHER